MAAITNGIRRRQRIVAVDVAIRASLYTAGSRHYVSTREGPTRRAVVEFSVRPVYGVVASRAHGCREVGRNLVRNRAAECLCAVPISGLAAGVPAIAGRQTVVVPDVALVAVCSHAGGRHLVVARQRPICGIVAPGSGRECRSSGVAICAVRCNKGCSRSRVHRIVRSAVVGLVAVLVRTTRRCFQVITTSRSCMAQRALYGSMQPGKWEAGVVVIEGGIGPVRRIVAGLAGLRKTCCDVVRNISTQSLCAVPIGGVAAGVVAIGNRQTIIVADVALVTICRRTRGRHLVITCQGPAGRSVAPRGCREGCCGGVAVGAIPDREGSTGRRVHRVVGAVVIGGVTVGVAARGHWSLEVVPTGRGAMTQGASNGGMQTC